MFFGLFGDDNAIPSTVHSDGNGSKISMKTKVGRNCKEYYERRGWKRVGDTFEGYYKTPHVHCQGRIKTSSYYNEFLIMKPPKKLRFHHKWACFNYIGDGWHSVHLHGNPDVSAGILSIEQLLEKVCRKRGKFKDRLLPIPITTGSVSTGVTVIRARQSIPLPSVQEITSRKLTLPELRGIYDGEFDDKPIFGITKPFTTKYQLPQVDFGRKSDEVIYTYKPLDPDHWKSMLDKYDSD
jgi:hypothetical protein